MDLIYMQMNAIKKGGGIIHTGNVCFKGRESPFGAGCCKTLFLPQQLHYITSRRATKVPKRMKINRI